MKVLVGTVGTPESKAAVAEAVEEVTARGGELHLAVHVPPPMNEKDARGHREVLASERERVETEAASLREHRGVDVHPHFLQGSGRTSHVLIELAEELGIERIVLGTRRRSAVGKLLLGSTASDILLAAPCPVLAVKAAADE